jgi:hypothetical protein
MESDLGKQSDVVGTESREATSAVDGERGGTAAAPTMMSLASQALGARGLQRKIQRRALQRRAEGNAGGGEASIHEAAERGVSGGGASLPHLDVIQRSFGRHDVSGIQAHTGSKASAASASIGAEAYATGNHVAFAGSPSLHTAAHEAAHVVQQRAGVHLSGGVGQEGDPYERHADEVADAVVQGRSAEGLLDRHAGPEHGGVQRKVGGAVQLKTEVFSKAHFSNPNAYLKGSSNENKVVEEPGSQGILGVPDKEAIAKLVDETERGKFSDKLDNAFNALMEAKGKSEGKVISDPTNALKHSTAAKKAENDLAIVSSLMKGLKDVIDVESAANFYRGHTLELSKLNALPKHVHNAGDGGHKTHVFHKDAGLIKMDASKLHGDQPTKTKKASFLNGPFTTGFVNGHNTIKNMKHRFIEHVHVDKDDETNGIDIYNADDESAGESAVRWTEKANEVDDMLHGNDKGAITTAIGEKNDADIVELKKEYDE